MATAESNRQNNASHFSRGRIVSYMLLGIALVLCFYAFRKPRRPAVQLPAPTAHDPAREIRMLGGRIDRSAPNWLKVSFTGANDAGVQHIQRLDHVKSLNLQGSQITDRGLAHLVGLVDLEVLNLSDTGITDEGLKHLRSLTNLRELKLGGTRLTGAGLAHLEPLVHLNVLFLERTQIDDEALAHISFFPQLRMLDISGSPSDTPQADKTMGKITDAGLHHLRESPNLNVVNSLHNEVTPEGVAQLKASLPNVHIYH